MKTLEEERRVEKRRTNWTEELTSFIFCFIYFSCKLLSMVFVSYCVRLFGKGSNKCGSACTCTVGSSLDINVCGTSYCFQSV